MAVVSVTSLISQTSLNTSLWILILFPENQLTLAWVQTDHFESVCDRTTRQEAHLSLAPKVWETVFSLFLVRGVTSVPWLVSH